MIIVDDMQHCVPKATPSHTYRAVFIKRAKERFDVKVSFYDEDRMKVQGDKENVKAFVLWHYDDDLETAQDLHPELF